MLVPGTVLSPETRALITMQGPAFRPIASTPMLFPGALAASSPNQSARAPLQGAAMLPMAAAPWHNQTTPYPSAYMASPAWPMYT